MVSSLNDPLIRSTVDQAATRTTRVVSVGANSLTITTPFPSPEDWRDVLDLLPYAGPIQSGGRQIAYEHAS